MSALPLLVAVLAAGGTAAECGLPPLLPERPWVAGETMSFDVDVIGVVKAGTLSLAVEGPATGQGQETFKARLRNTSVFAKIRRLRAIALSWADAKTLRPQRFRDDVDQDGFRRTSDTRFDRPGPVKMGWTSGADKGVTEFERKKEVIDLLSAVYLLRAADLRPGSEVCFDMLGNRRFWRVAGKVADRVEKVDAPAGSFQTIRLDARLVRADDPSKTRPLHLWISTDPQRLLVAAVSEVDLGPVRAMLERASGPAGARAD